MGLRFRKSIRLGPSTRLNLSRSGPSVSTRLGRTTVNSRGITTTNLGGGFSYQTRSAGGKAGLGCLGWMLALVVSAIVVALLSR